MNSLPSEYTAVEKPFIDQLKAMGWEHLEGDIDVPYLTERAGFRQVLLKDRLRDAIRRINLDEAGQPWLDEARINEAVSALERLGAPRLMEANQRAVEVQDLGYRWGSCGENGTVYFHWRTVLLPPRIIEYLVVHELVHLHASHHTDEFWRRMARAMPDHAEHQRWLAENGAAYDL